MKRVTPNQRSIVTPVSGLQLAEYLSQICAKLTTIVADITAALCAAESNPYRAAGTVQPSGGQPKQMPSVSDWVSLHVGQLIKKEGQLMSHFIIAYRGGKKPESPEAGAKQMAKWQA
ncbi:MAG: hypothetical protein OEQ74_06580, partial [Gammaproteobacteria bacterium]|nr:hypothetical protein [Gammaproteobacteria bacterium]